jgi:hypothetical protein
MMPKRFCMPVKLGTPPKPQPTVYEISYKTNICMTKHSL